MAPTRRRSSSQPDIFGTQGSGEVDRRFAELLKPIKDLTANWNVPLADYLQHYYEELTEIHVNLDGRTARVNFAEAALFLQGTASVYSKKVEFLWQTVVEMLDTLSSKRALDEADGMAGEARGKKFSKRSSHLDINKFSLVHLELARNIDLKDEATTGDKDSHHRKMALKFIFVTPRRLIEKGGDEVKQSRINLYFPISSSTSVTTYELIGHKEDFRVNMQFSMETGMIGEDFGYHCDLGQHSVSLCSEPSVNNTVPGQPVSNDLCGLSPLPDTCTSDEHEPPEQDGMEVEVIAEDEVIEKQNQRVVEKRNTDPKCDKLAEIGNELKAPLTDPWEPIIPQEEEATTASRPKPTRKGRTNKVPSTLKATSCLAKDQKLSRRQRIQKKAPEADKAELKVAVPVELFVIHELSGKKYSTSGCFGQRSDSNVGPEFKHLPTNARVKRNNANERGEVAAEAGSETEDHSDHDGWQDAGDIAHFDGDVPLPDPHSAVDVALMNSILPVGDRSDVAENFVAKNVTEEGDCYEGIVMKRVADFIAQSQNYIASTDLAKRVARWHESIGPKLNAVEKRGIFDVHLYGSRILDSFPNDSRKATVSFANIAAGQEREEVARLFLSSLMLANSYNVEIISGSDPTELAMDQMQLTLLTRKRYHESMFGSSHHGDHNSFREDTSDDEKQELVGRGTKRKKKPRRLKKRKRGTEREGHLNSSSDDS